MRNDYIGGVFPCPKCGAAVTDHEPCSACGTDRQSYLLRLQAERIVVPPLGQVPGGSAVSETPLEEWDRRELVERVRELEESATRLRAEVRGLTEVNGRLSRCLERERIANHEALNRLDAAATRLTARVGALEDVVRRGRESLNELADFLRAEGRPVEAFAVGNWVGRLDAALGPAGAPPEEKP